MDAFFAAGPPRPPSTQSDAGLPKPDPADPDPIAGLLDELERAALSCRPMHIEGRGPVLVRRTAGGFALRPHLRPQRRRTILPELVPADVWLGPGRPGRGWDGWEYELLPLDLALALPCRGEA